LSVMTSDIRLAPLSITRSMILPMIGKAIVILRLGPLWVTLRDEGEGIASGFQWREGHATQAGRDGGSGQCMSR